MEQRSSSARLRSSVSPPLQENKQLSFLFHWRSSNTRIFPIKIEEISYLKQLIKYLIEAAMTESIAIATLSSIFSISECLTEITFSTLKVGLYMSFVRIACSTGAEMILKVLCYGYRPWIKFLLIILLLLLIWEGIILFCLLLLLLFLCIWELDDAEDDTKDEEDTTDDEDEDYDDPV